MIYKIKDRKLDRQKLIVLIPDMAKSLKDYTLSLVMKKCVQKQMEPIWQVGLYQFFRTL